MKITVKARAKINLALDVTGIREDGYHNLRMIMQSVYLHDVLVIKKAAKYPLKLVCGAPYLPLDERNLVYKAAVYLKDVFNLPGGLHIELRKNIPISAGLAGGSSDCAAALLGINSMYNLGLSLNELMEIGVKFGADVPFCLLGGTALAEGKGELLTPLPPHPPVVIVIGKPPAPISTSAVFKAFDTIKHPDSPNIDSVISSIKNKDIYGIASGFGNVLEDVSIRICPDIAALKRLYVKSGAVGALMSGSGPSVFAYFSDQRQAWRAMKSVSMIMPHVRQFLTGALNDPKRHSDLRGKA